MTTVLTGRTEVGPPTNLINPYSLVNIARLSSWTMTGSVPTVRLVHLR